MLDWHSMERKRLPEYFLTAALVFVFAWFGIDKFTHPSIWTGFLPAWMDGLAGMPASTWILIIGAQELLFAVMLLVPVRRVRQLGALLIALHLVGVVAQVGWNDIGVRDIGLLLSSLALLTLL